MTAFVDLDRILLFVLLLARTSGLVAAAPFLGERLVPLRVKALFAFVLALLMLTFSPGGPPVPAGLPGLAVLMASEVAFGLAMGFTAQLLILAFEMAGHVLAIQMGFGMAQIFDPLQGHQGNLMGRWMWLVGITLFLGLDGHHHLLRALAGSLAVVPPGRWVLSAGALDSLVRFGGESLSTAMRIGAPAIGILLLTSAGLGILARTVPQMNIFIVGFPIKIAVGIAAVLLSLPYLLEVARREVGDLVHRLSAVVLAG